jgi:hypothetical protein
LNCFSDSVKNYITEFRITHITHNIPSNLYPNADEMVQSPLVIAHLALEMYINDVITLVQNGVQGKIDNLLESEDLIAIQQAKWLEKDLGLWAQCKNPLKYDNGVSVIWLVADEDDTALPPSSTKQLNLHDFCKMLVKVREKPRLSGAPFIPKGTFQHILPMALKKIAILPMALKKIAIHNSNNDKLFPVDVFSRAI